MAEPLVERSRDPRHLTVERVELSKLATYPDNARRSDLPDLIESIRLHDFYTVVTAQLSTRYVLVGNHRYMAQLAARDHVNNGDPGWSAYEPGHFDAIDVKWLDCDDDQARRVNVVDNPLGERGTYDDVVLAANLEALVLSDLGLAGSGYTWTDLDDLRRRLDVPDFDALAAQYGNADAAAPSLFPRFSVALEPGVHERWAAMWAELPGEDDSERAIALLDRL